MPACWVLLRVAAPVSSSLAHSPGGGRSERSFFRLWSEMKRRPSAKARRGAQRLPGAQKPGLTWAPRWAAAPRQGSRRDCLLSRAPPAAPGWTRSPAGALPAPCPDACPRPAAPCPRACPRPASPSEWVLSSGRVQGSLRRFPGKSQLPTRSEWKGSNNQGDFLFPARPPHPFSLTETRLTSII